MRKGKNFWLGCAAVVIFSIFHTFKGLAHIPIHDWDEARHGISGYEMFKGGDPIVHTFLGETDYYNLKPPLSFWTIAAGYSLFGVNALGLRFFSALCLPIIVLVFILFFRRYFSPEFALAGGLLFAVISVQPHHLFTRGDADAIFYLFLFLSVVFFIKSYLSAEKNLIGVSVCMALAFLAKASHIAVFALALFICMALLLKTRRFAFKRLLIYGLLPFIAVLLPWIALRVMADGAEFFKQMLFLDVIDRSVVGVDDNVRGPLYYIGSLYVIFGPVLLIAFSAIFCACVFVCFKYGRCFEPRDKVFAYCNILIVSVPLLFYSAIPTKLPWYIWPSTMGAVSLAVWLPYFLLRARIRGGYLGVAAVSVAIVIGLVWLPERYVSPNMLPVVFDSLPKAEERQYYVVNAEGGQDGLPQSSILGGIFAGYIFRYGGLEDFHQAEDALLILKYPNADARDGFVSAGSDAVLLYDDENGTAVNGKPEGGISS